MSHFSADVLILRSVERGEHDRLITVLSAEHGRFYAIVKGAGSIHRREVAATEPYTWSNVEFYEKNGVKWVKNATAKESFFGLRYDMDKLFLAAYIADVAFELSDEHEPAGEILPLVLNTYYALSRSQGEVARIKAAFELRAACNEGFSPDLVACSHCHCTEIAEAYLDVMGGSIVCRACFTKEQGLISLLPPLDEMGERKLLLPLNATALAAFRYVEGTEPKRLFAFRFTEDEGLAQFCAAAEAYLLHHLERGFASLENYKKLAAMPPVTRKNEDKRENL